MKRALAVSMAASLSVGCSTLDVAPVHGADGPSVVVRTTDIGAVKAAIIEISKRGGFKLEGDSLGENVWVSRPLSALKVFLLTETIPTKNDREQERFHIEAVEGGVRVYVGRMEQMELPGGRINEDPLLDNGQFEALRALLNEIKKQVEGG
jgi:hypothetical protein